MPAGVADHDVQPAKTLQRPVDQLLAEFLVPEIAGDRYAGPARSLDQVHDLFGVGLLGWEIVDRHIGAPRA